MLNQLFIFFNSTLSLHKKIWDIGATIVVMLWFFRLYHHLVGIPHWLHPNAPKWGKCSAWSVCRIPPQLEIDAEIIAASIFLNRICSNKIIRACSLKPNAVHELWQPESLSLNVQWKINVDPIYVTQPEWFSSPKHVTRFSLSLSELLSLPALCFFIMKLNSSKWFLPSEVKFCILNDVWIKPHHYFNNEETYVSCHNMTPFFIENSFTLPGDLNHSW
jgi:hypothetical protein